MKKRETESDLLHASDQDQKRAVLFCNTLTFLICSIMLLWHSAVIGHNNDLILFKIIPAKENLTEKKIHPASGYALKMSVKYAWKISRTCLMLGSTQGSGGSL